MHAEFWLAGWVAGLRAAANPAQMGWKWSAWGKCMRFAFYRHASMEVERGFWHKRIQTTTAIPELYD